MGIGSLSLGGFSSTSEFISRKIGSIGLPGGFVISPTYWQAGLIVLCLFFVLLTFALMQHKHNNWTVKAIMPGVAFGFTLALLLEAMLIVGGRTIFTELIGWEDAPKPVAQVIDASRAQLVSVMGVADAVPESAAQSNVTPEDLSELFNAFDRDQKRAVRELICPR